jgi:hypothetical protein
LKTSVAEENEEPKCIERWADCTGFLLAKKTTEK